MMKQSNQFQYVKSQQLEKVTVLQATMRDFSYGKHAHEEYSFGVTLTGRQDFFSSGEFHRSLPGNVLAFNPGEVHDGQSGVDDALHYKMLYIHPEQLEPMFKCAGIRNYKNFEISQTLFDDKTLRTHLLNMALLIEKNDSNKLQQECTLYQIAHTLANKQGIDHPNDSSMKADTLLLRARDFIHDNIHKPTSLDDISQHAHLSKYHFLRLFRQYFGITPHQYILNYRLNLARNELETGAALDDLVFKYGFSDLSHFNRRFKPVFGITPKQYQQLCLS